MTCRQPLRRCDEDITQENVCIATILLSKLHGVYVVIENLVALRQRLDPIRHDVLR